MKLLIKLLLVLFTINVGAQAKVNQKYCDRTVKKVTKELQKKIKKNEITNEKADLIIELVTNSCENAAKNNLTQKHYETLFDKVKASDCENTINEIEGVMTQYSKEDKVFVAKEIQSMCSKAVKDGDSNLLFLFNLRKLLKKYGIL